MWRVTLTPRGVGDFFALQRDVEGMVNALASELRDTEDQVLAAAASYIFSSLYVVTFAFAIWQIGAKMKVLDKDGDGQVCASASFHFTGDVLCRRR